MNQDSNRIAPVHGPCEPSQPLRTAVVIPSVDRRDALERAINSLLKQTHPPDQIVLSLPSADGVPSSLPEDPSIKVVLGHRGAAQQRNAAMRALDNRTEIVIFLDDDSLPRDDYVSEIIASFASDDSLVAITGKMACDGAAEKREISLKEMEDSLRRSKEDRAPQPPSNTNFLYGCNMAVRYEQAISTPFDEMLPLYSWLEDLDFARRLMRLGRIAYAPNCVVAHQGNSSGGRTQHVRFGYSSIANPIYLHQKGSINSADVARLITNPLLGNARGFILSRDASRLERLLGQAKALGDLVMGRLDPRRILELS